MHSIKQFYNEPSHEQKYKANFYLQKHERYFRCIVLDSDSFASGHGRFEGHAASVFTIDVCNMCSDWVQLICWNRSRLPACKAHKKGLRKLRTIPECSHFYTEDGGSILVRNKDVRLQDYTMSQSRKHRNPNNRNYAIFTTGVRRDIVMLVVSIG